MILHEALAEAGLSSPPEDGALLAAFVDGALRRALARVVGNDAADATCRRLIEVARRSTGAPEPPARETRETQVPTRNATPPRQMTVPFARVTSPGLQRGPGRQGFVEAPSAPPRKRDSRMSSSPPPRSGPAVRHVKLTPRPRMRALSDASKYTPPPFRPSGDLEASQQRPSQLPTHKPMPAMSSYVVVVTENENKGEPLAHALADLSLHAFVADGNAIPGAGDVPNVIVLDARERPVDEQTLARLLWRMGTKVIVWGSDDALRSMRRSYGRADHLFRCHSDVSALELAHVCAMLLG